MATAVPQAPDASPTLHARRSLAAVALVSFSSLLLELSLTRLFSVVLFYHFAFLAVSVALLGLGAGGVVAHLRRERLARWRVSALGERLCLLNSLAIVASLWVVLHVPVSLGLDAHNFLRLSALYLACGVPFFFTGMLFAVVFARQAENVGTLYGADLAGGALACLAVVPVLNLVGAPNAVLCSAWAVALAAAGWRWAGSARSELSRTFALAAILVLPLLIAANYSGGLFDVVYAKGARVDRGSVLFVRWNAISRVEVRQQGNARYIVIDADANSALMNVGPHAWQGTVWQRNLMAAAPAIANVLRPRGDYAIIGPGGGVDVVRAVANGSSHVTGIEINPLIAQTIMRQRFADYAFHLYDQPEVTIKVADGRSWLRSSAARYDVVQMTLVDTWASTAAGAFALSENNLYTRQAFCEYFEHLRPGGLLAITRWEFRQPREALRVVAEAMDAMRFLRASGASENFAGPAAQDLSQDFIVVSDGPLDEDGRPVTVLVSPAGFTPADEAALAAHLSQNPNLKLLYSPAQHGQNAFAELIASGDPQGFAAHYAYNVAPVTDDAPFFFFTLKTGPMLRDVLSGRGRGMDWRINLGVVVLGILLGISLAAVALFLALPLWLSRRREHAGSWAMLYFVCIGLGYILVEMTFIQRFVLFLGHPTYALTVVVFLMLLASGAGSLLARRIDLRGARLALPLVLIAMLLIANRLLLAPVLASLVGLPLLAKLAVSALLLGPVAFVMGMPFPSGLRALSLRPNAPLEWAWAMNAGASVLGSALAVVAAIEFGLHFTLMLAITAYALAAAASVLTLGRAEYAA